MTKSLALTVRVEDARTESALSASTADRLGLADGDAVTLRYGTDREATATVEAAADIADDQVVVPTDLATRLGVDGGETVTVAPVDLSAADGVTVAPVPRLSVRGGQTLLVEAIGDEPVAEGDTVTVSMFDGSLDVPFRVLSTEPSGPVTVGATTDIRIEDGPAPLTGSTLVTPLPASAVGGYEETASAVEESLATLFESGRRVAGTGPRAGMLLTGPEGVGKTHLLQYGAWATDATINHVAPQRLLSASASSVTDSLRSAATSAQGSEKGIIHLDAFDTVVKEADAATLSAVRRWLDRLREATDVVVVAEATDSSAVRSDLRQGGRLSKSVTVPEPGRDDRAAILSTLAAGASVEVAGDISSVGRRAFGYVAGDLVALWLTAVESAVERAIGDRQVVSESDVARSLEETEPVGLDGSTVDVPTTTFDDIGGLEEAKRELTRAVQWPLTAPELFAELDIEPPAGVLLYGPPGTGKTLLARAVASMSDANFAVVNGPELMNRYVGESERAVRRVFERAQSNSPSVLFFDEIDGIGATRTGDDNSPATERVVSQLLTELDGVERRGGVTVLGATNRPGRLDKALLRPGRFDRVVSVPMPNRQARAEIFGIHLADQAATTFDLDALAERTTGYTGSDIAAVVREAGLLAIESRVDDEGAATRVEDSRVRIEPGHLRQALDTVGPSLSPEAREGYESFDWSG
ncbi:AAA family ATPase [Halosimplex litoreum]|uniref:AAA family ATPase n=1 Tax=Halosimplex litoreum TaxID=1198301 RepID=A0A7T3KV82_9EURY|nr:AAA family ATPase [Halosimplex litoreum]QPV63059.1 AAA family ATPase [Halosimplex litoreum]